MKLKKVVIKRCSMYSFWYEDMIGNTYRVSSMDEEFFRVYGSLKCIHKSDCEEVVEEVVNQEPRPIRPEERFINDGFKNASDALSKLGVFEFKKRYRKRVLS